MRNAPTKTKTLEPSSGTSEASPAGIEASLIERAKEGEDWAIDLLVRTHQPVIARRIRSMCRNDADVEDIVQEVMITMFRKLDGFEGKSSLATWLYRVATNAFLLHERRKRRDRLTFIENEPYEDETGTFAWYPYEEWTDGFTRVYERELLDSVSKAMEALPESYRQVLLLRRRDGHGLVREIPPIPRKADAEGELEPGRIEKLADCRNLRRERGGGHAFDSSRTSRNSSLSASRSCLSPSRATAIDLLASPK